LEEVIPVYTTLVLGVVGIIVIETVKPLTVPSAGTTPLIIDPPTNLVVFNVSWKLP
jgi:hypothetical protein